MDLNIDLALAKLREIENEYSEKHIGFKRGADDKIIILEITGDNTEARMYDRYKRRYAKMRCSEAIVISIIDLKTFNKVESATSMFDDRFLYNVGKTVVPQGYDDSLTNICSSGIHYFLDPEPALYYNQNLGKNWDDYGNLTSYHHIYNPLSNLIEKNFWLMFGIISVYVVAATATETATAISTLSI